MPLLAVIGAFFSRLVASRVGFWVVGALAFLGINFVSHSFVVGPILEAIMDSVADLPASLIAWLRYLNIDRYITAVLSAYASAAAVGALRLKKA